MPYSPPAANAVNFAFLVAYTPPAAHSVSFSFTGTTFVTPGAATVNITGQTPTVTMVPKGRRAIYLNWE